MYDSRILAWAVRITSRSLETCGPVMGSNPPMLLLDERITADGTHVRTWATSDGAHVWIGEAGGPSSALPVVAVDRVMTRYGKPLDPEVVLDGDVLACGRYRLRRLRHRVAVDAEGRDYLVWERPEGEPLVCLAATITSALRFLAARLGAPTVSGI